jgi:cell division transport system permease protein
MHNTFTHMRRSPYQSLAAIITMFLTMLLTGVFLVTTTTSALVLQYFESKPQITVFFMDKAKEEDVNLLKQTVEATGKVASTKYVSKEDALSIYREQNKNDPLLLEMVTADILPASLEVSAVDPKYLSELEPLIKQAQGVEEVVYQKDVVDNLLVWTKAIRLSGGILVGLFALNAILIVMTVISMKIALKKDEIDILKLVGASLWYIRGPFVLEGGIYGAIGATLAWFILAIVIIVIRPVTVEFLGVIPVIHTVLSDPLSLPFVLALLALFGLLSGVGFLLGSIGSLIALRRYLTF